LKKSKKQPSSPKRHRKKTVRMEKTEGEQVIHPIQKVTDVQRVRADLRGPE